MHFFYCMILSVLLTLQSLRTSSQLSSYNRLLYYKLKFIIGDFVMGAAGNKKPKKPGKKHGPSYMEEEHEVPLKSSKKKAN